jgi:hypothetical protein
MTPTHKKLATCEIDHDCQSCSVTCARPALAPPSSTTVPLLLMLRPTIRLLLTRALELSDEPPKCMILARDPEVYSELYFPEHLEAITHHRPLPLQRWRFPSNRTRCPLFLLPIRRELAYTVVDAVCNKFGKNPQVEVSVIRCQLPPRDWISCSFIDHVVILEVHTVSSSKGDGWTIGIDWCIHALGG